MTARRSTGWRVERSTAPAATLLGPWPSPGGDDAPIVRASRVSGGAALVLGSTQDVTTVHQHVAAEEGVDVVRRSTGGGAVFVVPDAQVWIDVWVPRGHELWNDDVIRAAPWLGETWKTALGSLGIESLSVHQGRATSDVLSGLVCFAGLGPGELQVATAVGSGPKVMGLAQRRTRGGARFHTTAPLRWEPDRLLALLDVGAVDASRQLRHTAVGLRSLMPTSSEIGDLALIGAVEDAVIEALP